MPTYTTWQKVINIYPRANDAEPDTGGTERDALIAAKSNEFHGYIRHIHKGDLLDPVDENVKNAVAKLIVGELRARAKANEDEMLEASWDHISGYFFPEEVQAHALIDSIRRGSYVLTQDDAARDAQHPEAVPDSANTSTGVVSAILPHEYKSSQKDVYLIKCTTAGRVDVGTAKFDYYINNAATAEDTNVVMTTAWIHLANELYVRFRDGGQSSEQFKADDTWTITAVPTTNEMLTNAPRQVDFYQS